MSAPRLACATYGGGHVRAVLPVLAALRARGWEVSYLALTTAAAVAREAQQDHLTARDLLRDEDGEIRAHGERLAAKLPEGGPIPREESVAYLGFGYAGLLQIEGEESAAAAYLERGRAALRPTPLAERFLDRSRPDLVLATNSPRTERALLDSARARGLPTVCINDLFAPDSDRWLFEPGFADRICVLNAYVRDRFVSNGQSPACIEITGNPAFAPLLRRRRSAFEPHFPLRVLYISQQPMPGQAEQLARFRSQLLSVARTRDDLRITARLHPSESDTDWIVAPLRLEEAGLGVMASIEAADVVVTHGSTMGVEASLFGRPVLLDTQNPIAARAPLHLAGFAYPLRSPADLSSAIDRAVEAGPLELPEIPNDPVAAVVRVIEELGA